MTSAESPPPPTAQDVDMSVESVTIR
jgi:hypothetical protein